MGDYDVDNNSEFMYEKAGSLMKEESVVMNIEKPSFLLNDPVHLLIQEVLREHPLPFKLQDFQLQTLYCLGSLKNVILVAPTGSGKMMCAVYGVQLLQKIFGVKNGVGLMTQPIRFVNFFLI